MGWFATPHDQAAIWHEDNERIRTALLKENDEAVEGYLQNLHPDVVFSYPGAVATGKSGIFVPKVNVIVPVISLACGTRTTATTTVKFYKNFSTGTTLGTLSLNGATVNNVAVTNNVATITTSAAHGFNVFDMVTITGLTNTFLNGTWQIQSIPSSTTFTFIVIHANLASGADSGPVGQIYTYLNLSPAITFLGRQDSMQVETTVAGAANLDLTAVFEAA